MLRGALPLLLPIITRTRAADCSSGQRRPHVHVELTLCVCVYRLWFVRARLQSRNQRDVAEQIEEERAKIEARTPITEDVFKAWRQRKVETRRAKRAAEEEERRRKGIMTGREIFLQVGRLPPPRLAPRPSGNGDSLTSSTPRGGERKGVVRARMTAAASPSCVRMVGLQEGFTVEDDAGASGADDLIRESQAEEEEAIRQMLEKAKDAAALARQRAIDGERGARWPWAALTTFARRSERSRVGGTGAGAVRTEPSSIQRPAIEEEDEEGEEEEGDQGGGDEDEEEEEEDGEGQAGPSSRAGASGQAGPSTHLQLNDDDAELFEGAGAEP